MASSAKSHQQAKVGQENAAPRRAPRRLPRRQGPSRSPKPKALRRRKQPKLAARAIRKAAVPPARPRPSAPNARPRGRAPRGTRAPYSRIQGHDGDHETARRSTAAAERRWQGQSGTNLQRRVGLSLPLQIFAEGDSWFDYPVPFFGGGIIPRLEDRLGVPILNLAKAGDEVRYMLGRRAAQAPDGAAQQRLPGRRCHGMCSCSPAAATTSSTTRWRYGSRIGIRPCLRPSHIHQARFDTALALVRAGYEDLISLRDELSPSTHLVFHGYDFAIPDGRGICHLGPWLKPTFDLRKFPTRAADQAGRTGHAASNSQPC